MIRWRAARWASHPTIVVRLVIAVTASMALVLVLAAAFVFWRVQHALDRQLDQDLAAYDDVVVQAVKGGTPPPGATPGEYYQVFDAAQHLVGESDPPPDVTLIDRTTMSDALAGQRVVDDLGSVLPGGDYAYRLQASAAQSPQGRVVIVSAISRRHRDEALQELLFQLAIGDLLALAGASYVGYRTAKGALNPVERYRRAAAVAGEAGGTRLPVPTDRDDELTRLGHTLNDLLARLEASSAREHQFIADASHELRTPLSLLKAEVELALHRPRTGPEFEAVLRMLAAQIERLITLANGLLDLEQLTSGERVHRARVDLNALVESVAGRYQRQFEAAARPLVVEVDDVTAWLDERWVELALSNLVDNALRHGAGEVHVAAKRSGQRLVLSVEDTGSGFSADFADRAFDRFSRADESRSTRGSGLGLSIVAGVAAAHGGAARIDREAGRSRIELEIADWQPPDEASRE